MTTLTTAQRQPLGVISDVRKGVRPKLLPCARKSPTSGLHHVGARPSLRKEVVPWR